MAHGWRGHLGGEVFSSHTPFYHQIHPIPSTLACYCIKLVPEIHIFTRQDLNLSPQSPHHSQPWKQLTTPSSMCYSHCIQKWMHSISSAPLRSSLTPNTIKMTNVRQFSSLESKSCLSFPNVPHLLRLIKMFTVLNPSINSPSQQPRLSSPPSWPVPNTPSLPRAPVSVPI